jgi:hypothetical protein
VEHVEWVSSWVVLWSSRNGGINLTIEFFIESIIINPWSITVVINDKWWFFWFSDVVFVGEAEIFALEEFSLTESEVNGDVIIFDTSILPGVEVIGHGDSWFMIVVNGDVNLVIWCTSKTTIWNGPIEVNHGVISSLR